LSKWNFYKSHTLGEVEKNDKELIEKSEVIQESKEKNRRIMKAPDGHIFVTCINWTPKPSVYGVAVTTEGDVTSEEIAEAKEMVMEEVLKRIREVAKRKPDEFFIIHTPNEASNTSSVGVKFALPTVLDDEEANGRI
jgi:hypothetical protein